MTGPVTFQKKRVPAVVVVDSRNVHGQAKDLFGTGRHVNVAGVIDMFTDFGFAVEDVWVAIATQGDQQGSRWLRDALAANANFAAAIVSDPRGHVLEGRLVERGKHTEEKLVDVLCAIQIARLAYEIHDKNREGVILVMSEDMDLIPAYEFAAELGVTVYACSNDTVDTRAKFSGWCILPESSLEKAVGRPWGRESGSSLRRFIANTLQRPNVVSLRFKVSNYNSNTAEVRLMHNSGAKAVWRNAPTGAYQRGDPHTLYVTGCEFENCAFPILTVDSVAPPAWPLADCRVGEVIDWRTAGRVTIRFAGGVNKALEAPSGTLLPGMKVLALRRSTGQQDAWRYVGPIEQRASSPGWSNPPEPVVVRVTSTGGSAGALVRAVILASGQVVTLQPPAEVRAQVGMEFAAIPASHTEMSGGLPHVRTVSISSNIY